MYQVPAKKLPFSLERQEILKDYRLAFVSRQVSLIGRKEVLGGKAKFGIFGDGKEIAQLAMARVFKAGDWRSGYYRDQTFMFAIGACSVREFFAQLYAHPCRQADPSSAGRQMNSHFASRFLDDEGRWRDQRAQGQSAADLSPTGGQMARLVGLAYASKLYRQLAALQAWPQAAKFSRQGEEVAFGTIGNASTSEGVFWESINAAGVLQVPLALSIWDDGYGISVPNSYQTTKGCISSILEGFAHSSEGKGFDLYQVAGFDYPALIATYQQAISKCRQTHSPCIIHVSQLTQPQGHSTSGSHERYKSAERLEFERQYDGLEKMRAWMLEALGFKNFELEKLEQEALEEVESERQAAWDEMQAPILKDKAEVLKLLGELEAELASSELASIKKELESLATPYRRHVQASLEQALLSLRGFKSKSTAALASYFELYQTANKQLYRSHLYCETTRSPLDIKPQVPTYGDKPSQLDGRQIIQQYFDQALAADPRLFLIGEDIGVLGGVNLEFEGLQAKYGDLRVTDTGIREATILGQGIGAAMRGLRPIVDIQYLDYLIYALQGLADDLATLHYRSAGGQAAPVIIRTKGHRLEGIWHTGSPMGMLLGSLRGLHLCVPRNCVQAAGMYQCLLAGDDPAVVIEVLNGYRVKELLPDNLGQFVVPLGVPEILHRGEHITLVTYGANVRLALQALPILEKLGISVELIDVQTLLPFDRQGYIGDSIAKTHAVVFLDEDVPGGASAFMMQQVLEVQGAYDELDAPPRSLTAAANRSAYGSDGDYFCKPNREDLVALLYEMMHERQPTNFPSYR